MDLKTAVNTISKALGSPKLRLHADFHPIHFNMAGMCQDNQYEVFIYSGYIDSSDVHYLGVGNTLEEALIALATDLISKS